MDVLQGSGSGPGPDKVAAPRRGAAATDGPGPDPDPGPGPGSEHYYFSKVRVLVLNQPINYQLVLIPSFLFLGCCFLFFPRFSMWLIMIIPSLFRFDDDDSDE